jgi:hypothetical protein
LGPAGRQEHNDKKQRDRRAGPSGDSHDL